MQHPFNSSTHFNTNTKTNQPRITIQGSNSPLSAMERDSPRGAARPRLERGRRIRARESKIIRGLRGEFKVQGQGSPVRIAPRIGRRRARDSLFPARIKRAGPERRASMIDARLLAGASVTGGTRGSLCEIRRSRLRRFEGVELAVV